MKRNLTIGTRRSQLALWQANYVAEALRRHDPELTVQLQHIVTQGDKILDVPLARIGGKGLFTTELEQRLLDGTIDLAVHSLKDLPADVPDGLCLAAITARHHVHDAFVSNTYASLEALPAGARIGTSSLRRKAQLLHTRPDLFVADLRGNVDTRLKKLDDGQYDAIILAEAGLQRLGRADRITQLLPVDTMIRDKLWICPIKPKHQDEAYYSITRNEIIVPEKEQFQSGEAFYGTLFHEMVHSTGAEGVLDRLQPTSFGSKEYAREELVAELGSALIAQRYGMTKHIKEDSCAYLKGWLDELKESPQFIKTTLLDVKRASSIVTQKVDKIAQELEQNVTEEQENKHSTKERIFYASVAYLQSTDDTTQLDELKDKGDYKGLLALAKEYYDGNGMDEQHTFASPLQNRGDDLLIEDKDFAVVYNGSVGGTYDIMLKYTEQEVRDHIRRYGTDHASDDVKEVAKDMAAEEFDVLKHQKLPMFEMPNGKHLFVWYNRETDTLDAGPFTGTDIPDRHRFAYDHCQSMEANLQSVNEKLGEMEEYQGEVQEESYISGLHR